MVNLKASFFTLLILIVFAFFGYAQKAEVHISETNQTISIDGVLEDNEWQDGLVLEMPKLYDRKCSVYVTYDTDYLYIAFKNLVDSKGNKTNPEVLISTAVTSDTWTQDTFWYHVSYSCCTARGLYYFWEQCDNNPPDWQANTYPFTEGHNNVEIRIAWSALEITQLENLKLKMAFKLSDPLERHTYWPEVANIAMPDTWGTLTFN